MSGSPSPRVEVSKVGLLVGLGTLAFGVYASVSYFGSGGHGHGATVLRALVAIPIGVMAVYLSFSTVCSGCGATLARSSLSTSTSCAESILQSSAVGDGAGLAGALARARGQSGTTRIEVTVCPGCRLQAQVKSSDRLDHLTGTAAGRIADAVLPTSEAR